MTAEIFNILRIQPVIGTFFTKEQNKPGADKVIVLTQSYWQTQYQESPEVLGKEVRIDDEAYKVIGVAPRVLEAFDARMKFVVPLSWPAGRGESAGPLRRGHPVVRTPQAGRHGRPGGRRGQDPGEALRRRGTATVEGVRGALRHDDERRRGSGAARPAGAADAADAAGRRRVRAAHRLCQRGESPARPFQRPPVGAGHSIRARGRARDDCPAVPAGKPAVDVPRRGAGAGRGLGRAADDEFLPGEDAAPVAAGVARLARARIRRRAHASWSACSSA